jgi:hypothetical protein
MRPIHKIIRRAAVMAAAALFAGSFSAQSARATVIFDSQGFEAAAGYTVGSNVFNQPSAGLAFGSLGTNSTSGTTHSQVAGSNAFAGSNAAQVNWTTADGFIGYSPFFTSPGSNPVATDGPLVTVTTEFKWETPVGVPNGGDGPFMGIKAFGNNGAGGAIGGLGVDSATGELVRFDPINGFQTFTDDATLAVNTYALLTLQLNFTAHTYTETVSGPVSDTFSGSFPNSITSFYAAYMEGESTEGTGPNQTGDPTSATAFFDNYQINDAAVPEPGSLALLGLSGMALLGRRTRRSVIG